MMMNTTNNPILNLRIHKPVCGKNNKTYIAASGSSDATMQRNSVKESAHAKKSVLFQGKKGTIAKKYNFSKKPVCGKDGNTYINQWELDCKDVEKQCEGECPCDELCKCPRFLSLI